MSRDELRRAIRPSRQNLARLWLIRSLLVTALLVALFWLRRTGEADTPWQPLLGVLAGMVLINLALLARLRSAWPVSEAEFFANLLLDIAFLTAVLYFTGGSTNPLVSYYLIPLIISAAVLRPRFTWTIAALTIGAYTWLFFHYHPLGLFTGVGHGAMTMGAHFWGMWINFVFSALLISWFVVRMSATMRAQEEAVAQARERGLRDEQIISLASVAAGTAHELRTPLATMTVLVSELKDQNPQLGDDMALLQGQLARCDAILKELVLASEDGGQEETVTIGELFSDVLEKWALVRPEARLELSLPGAGAALAVRSDQSLRYALLSFLHNAADASPGAVDLSAAREDDQVLIAIEDRGPGIPGEVAASLGKRLISRKEGGLGVGVLLSSATIERLGGSVALLERAGGGTRLEIRLPLQA